MLETVATDDLGYPQVSAKPLLLKVVRVLQAQLTQPPSAFVGRSLELAAQVTGSEEASPKLSYEWSFGDGESEEGSVEGSAGGATITAAHTYASAGTHEVTLTITDKDGQKTETSLELEVLYAPPALVTGAASSLTQTTATLDATVDPEGSQVSECDFEYGTSSSYGKTQPCATTPAVGTSAVAVSASLSGLHADTTYHYRITARNSGGGAEGKDGEFTTLPQPPVVVTGAASSLTQTTATLGATVNPEGAQLSECSFEYGTSASYGKTQPCASTPAAGTSAVAVSAALTGLSAQTTYHYRITARNIGGTGQGVDGEFTTSSPVHASTGGGSSTSGSSGSSGSTGGSTSTGSGGTLPFAEASLVPTLSKLAQSHATWREGTALAAFSASAAPLGTVFSFTLSEAAHVSFAFAQKQSGREVGGRCEAQSAHNSHKARCERTLPRGTVGFSGLAGADRLAFQGRLSQTQRLAPGTYTVSVSAESSSGRRSSSQSVTFTILK